MPEMKILFAAQYIVKILFKYNLFEFSSEKYNFQWRVASHHTHDQHNFSSITLSINASLKFLFQQNDDYNYRRN
jgi:hypothetical protein